MVAFLDFVGTVLDKVSRWLTQTFVAIMALIITAQVIWRYFLRNPIFWAEELARYSLVWMTFVGAAVALREGSLANMDILVSKLRPSIQKWVSIAVLLVNSSLLAFLLVFSIRLVNLPSITSQVSPAMGIPIKYAYAAMPVGLSIMLVQSLLKISGSFGKKGE